MGLGDRRPRETLGGKPAGLGQPLAPIPVGEQLQHRHRQRSWVAGWDTEEVLPRAYLRLGRGGFGGDNRRTVGLRGQQSPALEAGAVGERQSDHVRREQQGRHRRLRDVAQEGYSLLEP